jgi:HAD superfamily hydrolase (TIGR01662 family)
MERADRALSESLVFSGVQLEPEVFRERLEAYYSVREQELYETTYHFILRELIHELGCPDLSEVLLRQALDAMFAVTQANWQVRPEAADLLLDLRRLQYRLGVVSNAGDDRDVQQLVQRFGIRESLDFVLTSAAYSYRKPHPRIFEIALARWIIDPAQVAMVGDTFEADIVGAGRLGLRTIWMARPEEAIPPGSDILPDAKVSSLADVLSAVGSLDRSVRTSPGAANLGTE